MPPKGHLVSDRPARDWPAFAGIDWGGSEHQLCVLDTTGTRLTQRRVAHDVAGLAELDTVLARHGSALPIAVERAEGLLVEHLQARGHAVFPVSPRIAARAVRGRAVVSPAHGPLQRPSDDVVHLPRRAAAQRPALVAVPLSPRAHVPAAVQARVEALQQLGVELRGLEVAERRQHVQADQVVVALA